MNILSLGINGVLFETPQTLVLDQLMSLEFDRQQLHKYIDKAFSIHSMGSGYEKVYQSLLS